ncbi:MAG TPA: hypothetical protein VIY86_04630 [Pirellulaceae bacterium]
MAERREKTTADEPEAKAEGLVPAGRQIVRAAGILVVFLVVAMILWRFFGNQLMTVRAAPLQLTNFEIPPVPAWIRSDVRAEVVRDAKLTSHTIQLEDLTLRVAEAFRMHSWVARVVRVTKEYPNRVSVSLKYRKPVAMVEVIDAAGGRGLFPVDVEGYLLPTADFLPAAQPVVPIEKYPRLRTDGLPPTVLPGTPWGDVRIHRGAALAAYAGPHWERLQLFEILGLRGKREGMDPGSPTFEIRTVKGTTILWGHAPGDEITGEATADKKLAQLADFLQKHGTLDAVQPDQTIDVRYSGGLEVATVGRQLR